MKRPAPRVRHTVRDKRAAANARHFHGLTPRSYADYVNWAQCNRIQYSHPELYRKRLARFSKAKGMTPSAYNRYCTAIANKLLRDQFGALGLPAPRIGSR